MLHVDKYVTICLKLQGNNYIKVLHPQILFQLGKRWEDSVMMLTNTQEARWKANHEYLDMRKEMNPPKQQMKCTYSLKHVRHVYAIAQMQGNALVKFIFKGIKNTSRLEI